MVFMRILGILILAIVIVLAVYLLVLRPWSHRRGATDAEVGRSLPGDDLVPTPKIEYTQAISIDAPPEEVWPWVVQMGYHRAGWYTYDWAYKLIGADDFYDGNRSADRIIPELQDLAPGDAIELGGGMAFEVVTLEPNRVLALLARVDVDTGESFELTDATPDNYVNISWVYALNELQAGSTRLIVRWHDDAGSGLASALPIHVATEAGALIMQPKVLRGIKARSEDRTRAEGHRPSEDHRRAEAAGGQ
jgi:preprotein translocase subunit YajC